jgi:hypothetical protein
MRIKIRTISKRIKMKNKKKNINHKKKNINHKKSIKTKNKIDATILKKKHKNNKI